VVEVAELVKQYGLAIALVIFFVWQSWVREKRTDAQIDGMRAFIEVKLLSVATSGQVAVASCQQAMHEVSQAVRSLSESTVEMTAATKSLLARVESRPCITTSDDRDNGQRNPHARDGR